VSVCVCLALCHVCAPLHTRIVLFLPLCDVGLMKNFVVVWLQSEASHLNVKKLDMHHANFDKPNIAEVILVCGNYKLVDCCSLNPSGVF